MYTFCPLFLSIRQPLEAGGGGEKWLGLANGVIATMDPPGHIKRTRGHAASVRFKSKSTADTRTIDVLQLSQGLERLHLLTVTYFKRRRHMTRRFCVSPF